MGRIRKENEGKSEGKKREGRGGMLRGERGGEREVRGGNEEEKEKEARGTVRGRKRGK